LATTPRFPTVTWYPTRNITFQDSLFIVDLPLSASTCYSLALRRPCLASPLWRAADKQAIQHRHPYEDVRDTALYYPLRQLPNVKVTYEGQYPGLKLLCKEVLGFKEGEFQKGEHCPVSLLQTNERHWQCVRNDRASLPDKREVGGCKKATTRIEVCRDW
jgi:hypothetical protein